MNEDIKYRIRERNGVFSIEVYAYKYKGILWWRRKEWSWYDANVYGGVLDEYCLYISMNFKSFKKAMRYINAWRSHPVYHEV